MEEDLEGRAMEFPFTDERSSYAFSAPGDQGPERKSLPLLMSAKIIERAVFQTTLPVMEMEVAPFDS
jgi:hypothetical protein